MMTFDEAFKSAANISKEEKELAEQEVSSTGKEINANKNFIRLMEKQTFMLIYDLLLIMAKMSEKSFIDADDHALEFHRKIRANLKAMFHTGLIVGLKMNSQEMPKV